MDVGRNNGKGLGSSDIIEGLRPLERQSKLAVSSQWNVLPYSLLVVKTGNDPKKKLTA
jgi:hypothetical protein